eukprot:354922-Chlamydomonas_euryale.AAC.9
MHSITWSEEATLSENYKANAFLLNSNKRFGRNANGAMSGVRDVEDKQAAGEETFEDDDGASTTSAVQNEGMGSDTGPEPMVDGHGQEP